MTKHHPENERIKRAYFAHLKAARGRHDATIDTVAKAIHRFEESSGFRSFKKFHIETVIAFRNRLANSVNVRTGEPLSKATLLQTLNALRAFFLWLAEQPGYRNRIRYSDAEYFTLSEKETRVAKTHRARPIPTPAQIETALERMPSGSDLELRNRALIAFAWISGARDGAIASLKLKHVNVDTRSVNQDAREVKTKFSKSQLTTFFPVSDYAVRIVRDWVDFLRREQGFGPDDPLFPSTRVEAGNDGLYRAAGLARRHWSSAGSIREIFEGAFESAGFPPFHPHSFRHALARVGEQFCKTPEEFKAWSQNLGHEQVLTTFTSYGAVPAERQAELIKSVALSRGEQGDDLKAALNNLIEVFGRRERV